MYPAVCPAFFIGNEQEMAEKKLIWSECRSSCKKRGGCIWTVSYTHLDVYKRQMSESWIYGTLVSFIAGLLLFAVLPMALKKRG